ncbi:MAG: carboxypeptidase-like regulatory domain-containing protein, partial [Gemmatimonadales bacterium]
MSPVGHVRSVPLLLIAAVLFHPSAAKAQSLVAGSMSGEVRSQDGLPLEHVRLALSGQEAVGSSVAFSRRTGRFVFADVAPGTYSLLVEIAGFQPVRYTGIGIRAGQRVEFDIELERRPPPVEEVEERPAPLPASASGLGEGQSNSLWLRRFDHRRPVTGLGRDLHVFTAPADGRYGLAETSAGLPAGFSRLYMDGIEEFLIRHPGLPHEPAHAPVFPRAATGSALGFANASDAEWVGTGGGLLSATSRRGGAGMRVAPWFTVSSSGLGGRGRNNPGDSSTVSLQGGATVTGAFAGGNGRYLLGGEYQSLERPAADPWENDAGTLGGAAVSLRNAIPV